MEQGESKEPNNSPFAEGSLKGSDFGSKRLAEFNGRSDVVVRFCPFEFMSEYAGESRSDLTERISLAKQEFLVLEKDYSIAIPEFQMAVGSGDGKEFKAEGGVYIITSRINGENLDSLLHREESGVTDEVVVEIDETFSGITRYLYDRFSKGKPFLDDIVNFGQFVYGVSPTQDSQEKKLYLVDLDPLLDIVPADPYVITLDNLDNTARAIRQLGLDTPKFDQQLDRIDKVFSEME